MLVLAGTGRRGRCLRPIVVSGGQTTVSSLHVGGYLGLLVGIFVEYMTRDIPGAGH